MKSYNGELMAYWEQGWEGRIEFFFQPDGSDKFFPLRDGWQLTIFNPGGTILWSGKLQFIRRSEWWDRHRLNADIWAYTKQKDVPYADWMEWFWHMPPLKARLETEESE